MAQLWPQTACNHCGESRAELVAHTGGYHLVKCTQCSLSFIADPPEPEALAAIYQGQANYHSGLQDPASAAFVKMAGLASTHLQFTRKWASSGVLVDVGCSTGMFLDQARRAGFNASGVEFSAASAQFARDHFGLTVLDGDIHAVGADQGPFDIVTMFDVIEHVRDPARDIAAAWQMLKPGGLFIVSTPNIDGLFPQASLPFANMLDYWPHPEPPYHLYQFSVATLSAMLEKGGFECLGTQHAAIELAYTFGTIPMLMRSPKQLAYALAFAPFAVLGPHIGRGDWFYLAARKC